MKFQWAVILNFEKEREIDMREGACSKKKKMMNTKAITRWLRSPHTRWKGKKKQKVEQNPVILLREFTLTESRIST